MVYYVIKLFSEAYTLQEDTMCNLPISTSGGLVFKAQYMDCMKYSTKWYWEQTQQQNNILVPTRTILHPCLDIMVVTEVKEIPNSLCNRNQAHKSIQRHSICLTDSDHISPLIK